MIKGEIKKEIYFTNDVFREVSKRISVPEPLVKEVFNDFINDLKQYILETDSLFYGLNPLGTLSINKRELDKNIRKLSNKIYKEKDDVEKQKLQLFLDNFKIREKTMRIEHAKFETIYQEIFSKDYFKREKNAMFKPAKFEAPYYNDRTKLKEAAQMQNNYAYNWYKKNDKPISH